MNNGKNESIGSVTINICPHGEDYEVSITKDGAHMGPHTPEKDKEQSAMILMMGVVVMLRTFGLPPKTIVNIIGEMCSIAMQESNRNIPP